MGRAPVALLVGLLACKGGSDGSDVDLDAPMRQVDATVASDEGWATFDVAIVDGDTSFLFQAFGQDVLWLDHVVDPAGNTVLTWEDWQDAYALTNAFYPCDSDGCATDFAFNWPVREADGPLTPGTWQVVVATTDDAYTWVDAADVDGTTLIKRDPDLSASVVRVRVVYATGVREEDGVSEAIEAAVAHWQAIWAPYGLSLEVRYDDAAIDPHLDFPNGQNDAISVASAGSDVGEITMLIGEDIDNGIGWLGFAGGIPGALVEGPRSAVIVGWLGGAGTDGAFTDDEIAILAGTMAHEVGHYQGLFHPVESGYGAWDALSDTPDCRNAGACEDLVGNNLMYFETVYDIGPQESLTDEQVGVIARYVGTP